jgi:hypothetical protein
MIKDEMIENNHDFLVTESTIRKDISLDSLDIALREKKMTGKVEIDYNQGGKRQIVVRERTKATEKQRDEIRQVFGMD